MPDEQPIRRLKPKDIIEGRVLPHTNVRYFERAGLRELDELDTGVFFVLAWWNGPAHIALDHLTKAILKTGAPGTLSSSSSTLMIPELYGCDLLRGKLNGNGETVWKKKGMVVEVERLAKQIVDYEACIARVLS